MERNVVTLETAKKLKAAGFPEDGIQFGWYKLDTITQVAPRFLFKADGYQWSWPWHMIEFLYAAPGAQEIADQLPKIIRWEGEQCYLSIDVDPFEQCLVAEYKNEDYETRGNGKLSAWTGENNLAEILAGLWLKLQEGKGK